MPENHVILCQSSRLVCKNVFNLSQILVHRGIVGFSAAIVLFGVSVSISSEDRTLEEFDHFHGDHEGDRDEVSHEKPPSKSGDPIVRHRDEFCHFFVAILKYRVKERTN